MEDISNTKQQNTQCSRALKFYTVCDANAKKYRCNICQREINGTKLSNLVQHFKNRLNHKDIYHNQILVADEQHILVQRESFIHSAVELVTINSEPFSLLSKSGFKNGHKAQLDKFKSAGCPVNLSDEHVTEIKEKVCTTAMKIKELIKSEVHRKIVSVMVDSATRNGRSIYGISIQYKHNGVHKVVAIGMRELKKSHTAKHLADVLLEILAEYEILLKQIISITTDNGSNMLAMVKDVERILLQQEDISSYAPECEGEQPNGQTQIEQRNQNDENVDIEIDELLKNSIDGNVLDELLEDVNIYEDLFEKFVSDLQNQTGNHSLFVNSIKCAAHTIQLAVRDALKMMSKSDRNVIELSRMVAKFLRKESTKNEKREVGITSILPGLDVETRWSSTYLMVKIIEQNLFFSLRLLPFFSFIVCRFAAF